MITKQFRIIVALLTLTATVSLPVSGGQVLRKAKPLKLELPPVYLSASVHQTVGSSGTSNWGGPVCKVVIVVRNNTGAAIRKGTTINWSVIGRNPYAQPARKGSFTLEDALPSGAQSRGSADGVPCVYVPAAEVRAWYVPVAMPPVY